MGDAFGAASEPVKAHTTPKSEKKTRDREDTVEPVCLGFYKGIKQIYSLVFNFNF